MTIELTIEQKQKMFAHAAMVAMHALSQDTNRVGYGPKVRAVVEKKIDESWDDFCKGK